LPALDAAGLRMGGTGMTGWCAPASDSAGVGKRLTVVVSGLGGDRPGEQAHDGGEDRRGEDYVESDGGGHCGSFFVVWLIDSSSETTRCFPCRAGVVVVSLILSGDG
jgi:hypothetical protein